MSALYETNLVKRLLDGVITKPWSIAAGPLTLGQLVDGFNSKRRHSCGKVVELCSEVRVREVGSPHHYTYSIVTPEKNNPEEGRLSCCSPLGFALQGKKKGDTVTVRALFGERRFVIDKVRCCGKVSKEDGAFMHGKLS